MKSMINTILLFLMAVASAQAADVSTDDIVKLIQQGGYVIYFRHAATDHTQKDVDRVGMEDCSKQRNLSEVGKKQAMAFGAGFKLHNIPVGKILSSPWCRTRDTANLGFGRAEIVTDLGFSISRSKEDTDRLSVALNKLLAQQPENGSNTLLFSHTSNLKEAANIWPKPEGAMAVFKPDASVKAGYKYIGMIDPEYWLSLIKE